MSFITALNSIQHLSTPDSSNHFRKDICICTLINSGDVEIAMHVGLRNNMVIDHESSDHRERKNLDWCLEGLGERDFLATPEDRETGRRKWGKWY
jgi:hypothetical protein